MKQTWALVLAIIGTIFGGIGTYYGVTVNNKTVQLDNRCADIEQNLLQVSAKADKADKVDAGLRSLQTQIESELAVVDSRFQAVDQKLADMTAKPKAKEAKEGAAAGDKPKSEKMAKPANGIYVAEKGDTIDKIAKKFGVNKWKITDVNPKLEIDKISAGTKVRIP